MKFRPHNNMVLLQKTNNNDELENVGGLFLKTSNVDLYKVIDISPGNESKAFPFEIGDTVTACAIGTDLIDEESGQKFVLMNADHVTAKVVS